MADDESASWLTYRDTYPNWSDTWGFDPKLEKREERKIRIWRRVKQSSLSGKFFASSNLESVMARLNTIGFRVLHYGN